MEVWVFGDAHGCMSLRVSKNIIYNMQLVEY